MSLTKVTNSMIQGANINALDYMTAAQVADVTSFTGTVNVTAAVQAAIDAAITKTSCIVNFPAGRYLIDTITIFQTTTDTAALTLQGATSNLMNTGTMFIANSVQTNFMQITGPTISIVFADIDFDSRNKCTNTVNFNPQLAGKTTSYNKILRCNFIDVADGGYHINTATVDSSYVEVALMEITSCGFTANSQIPPYNQFADAAINMSNAGAWGWNISDCHFDGQNKTAHLRLYNGTATLNNCIFDNTNTAGTSDIKMWGSFGLTTNQCHSGSGQEFLHVVTLTAPNVAGTNSWFNFPITINSTYHYRVGGFDPTVYSVYLDNVVNPLTINEFKTNSKGLGIDGAGGANVPNGLYLTNCKFITPSISYGLTTQFIAQAAGTTTLGQVITDTTLFKSLSTSWDALSNTGFTISTYEAGVGTLPLFLSADKLAVPEGVVELYTRSYPPTNSTAGSASMFVRLNGGGKLELCAVFPTGAVQVLATQL